MRRVLCVWLPTFSTDLVRRRLAKQPCGEPGSPARPQPTAIILTRPVASRELVARRCQIAARSGVLEQMDLAHARSLLPASAAPHVEPHRPDRDAEALHALACRALRFSPQVAPDPPDGLLIDITGTERLHRGETRLIRTVAMDIRRLGFSVRLASAATFGCAWAVARFARHDLCRVPPGREEEAIRRLPLAALRIDAATAHALHEVGITEINHLLNLPRSSLAARFDKLLLRRLRQALGDIDEHIEPVRPTPPVRVELLFDGPTDHWESIESAVKHVLGKLAGELATLERGVRRVDLDLLRPRAAPIPIRIDLSRPSAAARHLWSLVRSHLERVHLDDGVEGVVITAARTGRLRHEQPGIAFRGTEAPGAGVSAWNELVDTLVARLGPDGVVCIDPVESHLPERAFRVRSVMEASARTPAAFTNADRPSLLFPNAEPAGVMALTSDAVPKSLAWRGRTWSIIRSTGPERIAQPWWLWAPPEEPASPPARARRRMHAHHPPSPPDRDYFAVQTSCGRCLWMFRHTGTHRWFVHGEWS